VHTTDTFVIQFGASVDIFIPIYLGRLAAVGYNRDVMTRVAPFLLLIQVIPMVAYAFQFDMWTSGISSREAMAMARNKNIPIIREGIVSINKHFDPNVSMKYIDTAHEFYYRANLLGETQKLT
jgi:hypothetical protein